MRPQILFRGFLGSWGPPKDQWVLLTPESNFGRPEEHFDTPWVNIGPLFRSNIFLLVPPSNLEEYSRRHNMWHNSFWRMKTRRCLVHSYNVFFSCDSINQSLPIPLHTAINIPTHTSDISLIQTTPSHHSSYSHWWWNYVNNIIAFPGLIKAHSGHGQSIAETLAYRHSD